MAPNWDRVMFHYFDSRDYKPLASSKGFTFGHFVKGILLIVGLIFAAIFFHAYWIALKS